MSHNRTLLRLGGNPMMLDLKNVCLAAKTTNGNSGTLSWGSGFVPDFVILLCIVSERCFIRTLRRGVGAKDFSWILKGPDTRSRNLYGKVLTKHIFCQNWKSINIWNIAIRNCWPKIFMWEIHASKRHVPIKRNLWSSKQSTQSLDEKSRFVVSHPAPPILLHRFVKKFGGPTPKRWWFVVSGHDQPRLMGVVLGHRSFPYLKIQPWNLKNLEDENFLISRGEKVNSQDSSRSSVRGIPSLQNGGRFINPLLVGACIGWFHTHHGLSRTTQDG